MIHITLKSWKKAKLNESTTSDAKKSKADKWIQLVYDVTEFYIDNGDNANIKLTSNGFTYIDGSGDETNVIVIDDNNVNVEGDNYTYDEFMKYLSGDDELEYDSDGDLQFKGENKINEDAPNSPINKVSTNGGFTIDTSRVDSVIANYMSQAEKTKKFLDSKVAILNTKKNELLSFLKKFGGSDLVLENMYSTGMTGREYNDDSQLIVHGKFKLNKEYKNTKLLAQKLEETFNTTFKPEMAASFNDYKIKDNIVAFQMWVR